VHNHAASQPNTASTRSELTVGFVGLGAMGSPMSRHLIEAGWTVFGTDPSATARRRFVDNGGTVVESPADLAERAPVVVTSLPSAEAVFEVLAGGSGLGCGIRPDAELAVLETSTLAPADKLRARDHAQSAGIRLYDCPVSGTSAQAENKDLVAYLSGPDDADRSQVLRVLDDMTRRTFDVGSFGAGTTMKLVANLLVAVHNMAAAEALVLAGRSGLDLGVVLEAIGSGAGSSRMFEVRGPLMARGTFADEVTAKVDVFAKDLRAIGDLARSVASPTPLFAATEVFYRAAQAQGRGGQDTACVYDLLAGMCAEVAPQ
jgi:L-threonate 2-dehydrogenase